MGGNANSLCDLIREADELNIAQLLRLLSGGNPEDPLCVAVGIESSVLLANRCCIEEITESREDSEG
jgi:hypothetical protein